MGSGGIPSKLESECLSFSTISLPTTAESGCLSIVVLGASGDLAKKKTFPALFNLYRQGFLATRGCLHFGICSNTTFK